MALILQNDPVTQEGLNKTLPQEQQMLISGQMHLQEQHEGFCWKDLPCSLASMLSTVLSLSQYMPFLRDVSH